MSRDPASDQLINYEKSSKGNAPILLTGSGNPIDNNLASLSVGPRGPLLLSDNVFIDEMTHFNRERIPERLVHAKGTGAFGYFLVTHDITRFTKAKVFSSVGKKTPLFTRFSTGDRGQGSPDLVRGLKGFVTKFYTEEGIWDLLCLNTPVIGSKDPIDFIDGVHSGKKNPVTNLNDADMLWDFITLRTENTHLQLILFSDRGIPDGYRHMGGFGVNTFKLVNDKNEIVYCRFVLKPDQGVKYLLQEKADEITKTEPDYSIRDLYNAIARGDYPSWTLYMQIMTPNQAKIYKEAFDVTKVWKHKEFPLNPVGRLILNKNPKNHFTDVEQAAFFPGNMPPGIEVSPDRILQSRIFVYGDTQRHRLGANHLQLPINCPYKMLSTFNYQRDGIMALKNQDGAPNYYPNSFNGPVPSPAAKSPTFFITGEVDRYDIDHKDDFIQATDFYRNVLNEEQRKRLVKNIVASLKQASLYIIERGIKMFSNVDADLGRKLIEELKKSGVPINVSGMSAHF